MGSLAVYMKNMVIEKQQILTTQKLGALIRIPAFKKTTERELWATTQLPRIADLCFTPLLVKNGKRVGIKYAPKRNHRFMPVAPLSK